MSMTMIRWRVLLVRTLMIGVPLTFVGAAFTWDALHPESLLPFIAIVPAIVLKYMNAVPPAIFPLVFVALQFAYYFAIVSIFYCVRSRHRDSALPKDGSRDG